MEQVSVACYSFWIEISKYSMSCRVRTFLANFLEFPAIVLRRWLEEPVGIFYAILIFIVFRVPEQIPDILTRVRIHDGEQLTPPEDWLALFVYLLAALTLSLSVWYWTFAVNGAEAWLYDGRARRNPAHLDDLNRRFRGSPYMAAAFAAGTIPFLASIAALWGPIIKNDSWFWGPIIKNDFWSLNPVVVELFLLVVVSLVIGWLLAGISIKPAPQKLTGWWYLRITAIFTAAPFRGPTAGIAMILSFAFGFFISQDYYSADDYYYFYLIMLSLLFFLVNYTISFVLFDKDSIENEWKHGNSFVSFCYILIFLFSFFILLNHSSTVSGFLMQKGMTAGASLGVETFIVYSMLLYFFLFLFHVISKWCHNIRKNLIECYLYQIVPGFVGFVSIVLLLALYVYGEQEIGFSRIGGQLEEFHLLHDVILTSAPITLFAMAFSVGPLLLALSLLRDLFVGIPHFIYSYLTRKTEVIDETSYEIVNKKVSGERSVKIKIEKNHSVTDLAHDELAQRWRIVGRLLAFLFFASVFVFAPFSFLTDKKCNGGDCPVYTLRFSETERVAARRSLQEEIKAWACGRKLTLSACEPSAPPRSFAPPRRRKLEKVPLVIVAAEGGASRAAAWTLSVLHHLQREAKNRTGDCPADRFSCHLFAISAVSGGALGAVTYLQHETATSRDGQPGGPAPIGEEMVSAIASADLLAPSISRLFLADALRRTGILNGLSWVRGLPFEIDDRNVALEKAFESHWEKEWNIPHNQAIMGFLNLHARSANHWPATHLLLNGVDVETGQRVVTSTLAFEDDQFSSVVEFFENASDTTVPVRQAEQRDIPASTAVMNAARFPYISPAGRYFAHGRLRQIIDGGYFENYGVETALELIDLIEGMSEQSLGFKPVPILIVISNPVEYSDPAIACAPTENREAQNKTHSKSSTDRSALEAEDFVNSVLTCDNLKPVLSKIDQEEYHPIPEGLAPLAGLYRIRTAHGQETLLDAVDRLCRPGAHQFFHLALPKPTCREHAAPMNWVLDDRVKAFIVDAAPNNGFNREQIRNVIRRLQAYPPATLSSRQ